METSLEGKTAIVTGASRGFGREIARSLAAAGASLALVARSISELEETARLARAEATDPQQAFRCYPADLSRTAEIASAVRAIRADFASIDILVNNAAIQGPIGAFETVDPRLWRAVFDVNVFAPAEFCRLLIGDLRRSGRGRVINISGGGAAAPRAAFSAYAASKAALVRWSETMAQELAPDDITVNCVAPGGMNTRMLSEIVAAGPEGSGHEYARAVEQSKTGGASPRRAAELVLLLASRAGDGITGRLISAVWDDWKSLPARRDALAAGDVYTLRRIVPADRGITW